MIDFYKILRRLFFHAVAADVGIQFYFTEDFFYYLRLFSTLVCILIVGVLIILELKRQ